VHPTTPVEAEVTPEPEHDELTTEEAAPPVAPPAPVREQITLEQLRHVGVPHATLGDVVADDSVTFDPNPRSTSSSQYGNLK